MKGIIESINIQAYEAFMNHALKNDIKDRIGYGRNWNLPYEQFPDFDNRILNECGRNWDNSQYTNRKTGDTDYRRKIDTLKKRMEYADIYGQPFTYETANDHYVIAKASAAYGGFINHYYYLIPHDCCVTKEYKDYADTPVSLIGTTTIKGAFPSIPDKSENQVKSEIEQKQDEIEAQQKEIKKQKEAVEEEIRQMKAAIEAKYKSTFDLLEQKKNKLDLQKEQLENELFFLDANIYAIRCANGEVIKFTRLTEGTRADEDAPLILYQKIRFLDEELSKYVALYGFDGDETNTELFEELIKNREDLRDLFFAKDKSVSLVRITRDNKHYSSGQRVFVEGASIGMQNVINEYEVFHGKKIAILLRDGENCYIGWTDDDRVLINDGNAFLKPETHTDQIKENKYESETEKKKRLKEKAKRQRTAMASRFYLFSAIQGAINRGIIRLPDNTSVMSNSPYIVFSMADNWLTDAGYGSLSDLIERFGDKLQVGDDILSTQSLQAEKHGWIEQNDRGIGYNNRTHDVVFCDNTIYPINHIEKDERYVAEYIQDGVRRKTISSWCNKFTNEKEFLKNEDASNISDVSVKPYVKKDYYVSLEKRYSGAAYWKDNAKKSRANFLVYKHEFIQLTFLNSDYIKNVLITRNLGASFPGYNFSTAIQYLNHIIDYLTKREEVEESKIRTYLDKKELPSDWKIKLSEWKYKHNVHAITDYQAKRFAKTL